MRPSNFNLGPTCCQHLVQLLRLLLFFSAPTGTSSASSWVARCSIRLLAILMWLLWFAPACRADCASCILDLGRGRASTGEGRRVPDLCVADHMRPTRSPQRPCTSASLATTGQVRGVAGTRRRSATCWDPSGAWRAPSACRSQRCRGGSFAELWGTTRHGFAVVAVHTASSSTTTSRRCCRNLLLNSGCD